jgi:hypothetical protein
MAPPIARPFGHAPSTLDRPLHTLMQATHFAFLACLAPALAAQGDLLHYTFDATDSTRVVDFAGGNAPGTTSWPASQCYAPGAQGRGALAASTFQGVSGRYVNSGWIAGHTGALTIAFFLRNQLANSVTAYSPVAGQPSWSIATGGSAGAGLQLHGVTAGDLNADFGLALCSLPGWNHFAVVVDPAAQTVTWYRNGAVATTAPLAGAAVIAPQSQLRVGTDYVTPCGSLYDIDEFRMSARAVPAAEIAAWAAGVRAAVGTIAATTTAAALVVAQPPRLGTTMATSVVAAGELFAFAAGTSHATFAGRALPVPLHDLLPGAGAASWHVSIEATLVGALPGGVGEFAIAIPNHPWLAGFELYAQAAVLAGGAIGTSNALALRLGH